MPTKRTNNLNTTSKGAGSSSARHKASAPSARAKGKQPTVRRASSAQAKNAKPSTRGNAALHRQQSVAAHSQQRAATQRRKANAYAQTSRTQPVKRGSTQAQTKQLQAQRQLAPSRTQAAAKPSAGDSFFQRHAKPVRIIAAVLIVFLALGVVDGIANFGKIHAGVSIQGIDVGGLTVEDAAAKVNDALSQQVQEASLLMYENDEKAGADGVDIANDSGVVTYSSEATSGEDVDGDGTDDKWRITADTLSLAVDGEGCAQSAYAIGRGFDFFPTRLFAYFGAYSVPAKVRLSDELFNDFADEVNDCIGTSVKNAKVKMSGSTATVNEGREGWLLNKDLFIEAASNAVFNTEKGCFTATMASAARAICPETAQRVADQVNEAIASPVTMKYGENSYELSSETLAGFISQKIFNSDKVLVISEGKASVEAADQAEQNFDPSAGIDEASGKILQAYIDPEKFDSYLDELLGDTTTKAARNASFYVKNGKVKIKKSKEGIGPDRNAVEYDLQNLLFGTNVGAERVIELVDTVIQPSITTEDAQNMGVKDRLSGWKIPLSGSTSRINNIKLLCKLINGSLVAPGATWSFNETTGERTEEKGFEKAPVIVNGKHEDQTGGGVCQVATCVFNAACYAGLGIETRTNHEFYIPSYDDYGFADATVSWETPDLAWVNDTANYIMVSAEVTSEDVVVTFYGTDEGREVTCDRGEWKKGDKYKTIKEEDDELEAGTTSIEQSGVDGRSIVIHYIAKDKDGNVLHDIEFNSVYSAQNEIIKVGTKSTGSSESSKSGDGDEEDDSDSSEDDDT